MDRLWVYSVFVAASAAVGCGSDPQASSNAAQTGGSSMTGGTAASNAATTNTSTLALQGGTNATGGTASMLTDGTVVVTGGTVATSSGGAVASSGGAATGGATSACSGTPTLGSITPAELNTELAEAPRTFLLINVHIPVNGHIPGTDTDIAYNQLAALEQYIGTDKARQVVIYCMSDAMSNIVGPELAADGYCQISQLQGGMSAWQNAGYPVDP